MTACKEVEIGVVVCQLQRAAGSIQLASEVEIHRWVDVFSIGGICRFLYGIDVFGNGYVVRDIQS